MGAPKQKWTAEEESALKAGVQKHGHGKWRTILKDPEFSGILCLRSNVDLKDKWRNLSVTANGWGSREKAKAASKRSKQVSKNDNSTKAVSMDVDDIDDDIVDAKPVATTSEKFYATNEKRPFSRMDNLILEALTYLDSTGSNQTTIALYIEERYVRPPDFTQLLSATLKEMTASGRLVKVKRGYRIPPLSASVKGKTPVISIPEERQIEPSRIVKDDFKPHLRSQVDPEFAWMHNMTAEEATAAAAQAVAEAEEATVRAEVAMKEAEALEADAEAAQAFVHAVILTFKNRNAANKMVRV